MSKNIGGKELKDMYASDDREYYAKNADSALCRAKDITEGAYKGYYGRRASRRSAYGFGKYRRQ